MEAVVHLELLLEAEGLLIEERTAYDVGEPVRVSAMKHFHRFHGPLNCCGRNTANFDSRFNRQEGVQPARRGATFAR
jgi:hypothetical protein